LHFQRCRGNVWKVTAVLASAGEAFGWSFPFWRHSSGLLSSPRGVSAGTCLFKFSHQKTIFDAASAL
jgi:hypothetical protein